MANLTMNRGDQLIFNNNLTADTYLTLNASNLLQRYLLGTKIDEVKLLGASATSDRAIVFNTNGNVSYAIPLDLTSASIQQAIDALPAPPSFYKEAGLAPF